MEKGRSGDRINSGLFYYYRYNGSTLKKLVFLTFLFFILLFVSYLLERSIGPWMLWIDIPLFFFFLVLCGCLIYQIYLLIKKRFKDPYRIATVSFMICILGFSFAIVTNIIRIDRLYGKDIFVAGTTSEPCATSLRLKDSGLFMYESYCFARTWNVGKYIIDHDTIYFSYTRKGGHNYSFAVIEKDSIYSEKPGLRIFTGKGDTYPLYLPIVKNNLGLN